MFTTVIGNGPVEFTDRATGKQFSIPLSFIKPDLQAPESSGWVTLGISPSLQPEATNWLKYLFVQGVLTVSTTSISRPAFLLKAAQAGVMGNNIKVEFTDVVADPPAFAAKITAIDTFAGLSVDPTAPNFVQTVLTPGLVQVKTIPDPAPFPAAGTYILDEGGGDGITPAFRTIPSADDPTVTAFVLEATQTDATGNGIQVTITSTPPTIFTLQARLEQNPTDISLSDLPAKLAGVARGGVGYLIEVSAPTSGFALPTASTIYLKGGTNTQAATPAQATILLAKHHPRSDDASHTHLSGYLH